MGVAFEAVELTRTIPAVLTDWISDRLHYREHVLARGSGKISFGHYCHGKVIRIPVKQRLSDLIIDLI